MFSTGYIYMHPHPTLHLLNPLSIQVYLQLYALIGEYEVFPPDFCFVKITGLNLCMLCFYYDNILSKRLSLGRLMEWSRVHCVLWERGENIHEMHPHSPCLHSLKDGWRPSSCLLDPMSGMAEHFPILIHLTTAHVLWAYNIAFTSSVTDLHSVGWNSVERQLSVFSLSDNIFFFNYTHSHWGFFLSYIALYLKLFLKNWRGRDKAEVCVYKYKLFLSQWFATLVDWVGLFHGFFLLSHCDE